MAYALPLLGILAIVMFYSTLAPVVMSGAGVGEALAACMWTVITIGVYYYLITYLPYLTDAALQTFVQWGLAPAGAFTLGDFLLPSCIIRAGWTAA
jgi:type IV secretory pathway TrbL component